MQAIETKFLGPTNTKGARIKASVYAKSITVPYAYEAVDRSHDEAARALITKLGWWGVWARGGKTDGTGNVYVCISRSRDIRTPPPVCTNPLDYIVVLAPEVES